MRLAAIVPVVGILFDNNSILELNLTKGEKKHAAPQNF